MDVLPTVTGAETKDCLSFTANTEVYLTEQNVAACFKDRN